MSKPTDVSESTKGDIQHMHPNVRIIQLGLGKVVSNFGTHGGVPCIFIEPVVGNPGVVGERLEEGREPQIMNGVVSDGGVIIEIHNRRGLDILLEDFQFAMGTPAASPVAPPESELDKEITRWQKAIYDLCREESGDDTIDGGGCDSGDPLDFTLAEISEAFGILKDKLASPVAGGSARIAERPEAKDYVGDGAGQDYLDALHAYIDALESVIERLRHKLHEIPAIDAALLERRNKEVIDLRNALAADATRLVPEGWVKVTPETMPPDPGGEKI